jgi:recombination protein RecA
MPSLAINRLESLLQARKLDGALAKPWVVPPACASAGIDALDDRLGGGWRRGEVSEITGARSSGRTSLLIASLRAATARGEVAGLVDTFDRFDPPSAAAAGVELSAVLWVRGPALNHARHTGGRPATTTSIVDAAVHRAIRACDLLIRAGGFGLIALDLADVPARALRALPWTTWRRLAHALEGHDTAALIVADAPVGRSARGSAIRLAASTRWTGDSSQARRLAGLDVAVHVVSGASSPSARDDRPVRIALGA